MPPEIPTDAARVRYRRLPGRTPSFQVTASGSSVLWLGDDHLLQVNRAHYTERYKRFSYGDIQALLLRETPRGLIYSFVLAALGAGFGLSGFAIHDPTGRGIFFGIGGFWVVLLLINLIRGDTCRCQLQTAAGPHLLPSLARLRPTRQALRLITEKVEAAQGALEPAEAARQMDSRAHKT